MSDFSRMHNEYLDPDRYFSNEETNALGEVIATNVKAIFDCWGAKTMGQLQRDCYKYTDAGIAVSFELHDGSFIYPGDKRAYEIKDPQNWIRAIGVSSIVEGSDAEVPLTWLDLASEKYADEDGDKLAVKDFNALCDEVNDEACALWEEANAENNETQL